MNHLGLVFLITEEGRLITEEGKPPKEKQGIYAWNTKANDWLDHHVFMKPSGKICGLVVWGKDKSPDYPAGLVDISNYVELRPNDEYWADLVIADILQEKELQGINRRHPVQVVYPYFPETQKDRIMQKTHAVSLEKGPPPASLSQVKEKI